MEERPNYVLYTFRRLQKKIQMEIQKAKQVNCIYFGEISKCVCHCPMCVYV